MDTHTAPSTVRHYPDKDVVVAYLHREHLSHSFVESLRATWEYDREHSNLIVPKPLNMHTGAGNVFQQRNFAARLFLDNITGPQWLLFIDTDMGFEPDAVERLLMAADPVERPVVGALCFALMQQAADGMNGYRHRIVPTMYKLGTIAETGQNSFCYYGPYIDDTVTQVAATGAAFLLIHRAMLVAIREQYGDTWFNQMRGEDGLWIGEDFSFCAKANAVGGSVWVHTGVKTTHHKEAWFSEQDYLAQLALDAAREDDTPDKVPAFVHIGASLATLANNEHVRDGMLKLEQDLDRYADIIDATKPDLIIETGTWSGASARWFASRGPNVISIDVSHDRLVRDEIADEEISFVKGSSVDPGVVARVKASIPEGTRVMVVLDSDHSVTHVTQEIAAWADVVTPGCYLVVEDTIFGWAPPAIVRMHFPNGLAGTPIDAVEEWFVDNPQWARDVAIERKHPISHHPGGWWRRREAHEVEAEVTL